MLTPRTSRRQFLQQSAAIAAGLSTPYLITSTTTREAAARPASDRPLVGVIGVGGRGLAIAAEAARFGDIAAVCDVDSVHAERAKTKFEGRPDTFGDYRRLLDRHDIDVVLNATPDHWHTAINVAACQAGKDVYAEKPLTLTIEEGKVLRRVVQDTQRVVQVGTQQRSEKQFQTAVELVRNGRVGQLQSVTVILPFWSTQGGPFPTTGVPDRLDWDFYQGQAPQRDYCFERTHFVNGGGWRWWYEYAGGIMTDWGNHHMDIAHWAMNLQLSGPLSVEGEAHFPNQGRPNCYSTPDRFEVRMTYPGGISLLYKGAEDSRNGIMFTGDQGRIFVNRGGVYGKPMEALSEHPLPADAWRVPPSDNHMKNFFECVRSRQQPVSTVDVQHRTVTACHLANLAVRLQRKIMWDAQSEQIVDDAEARAMQRRDQRAPYQVQA